MKAIVRDPAIEKMEVALPLWIEDRNQKRVPLSGPMVRVKGNSTEKLPEVGNGQSFL
uniref:Uncharacterized protein n=1 Tax=Rhodnius prolixus TaxID=13249 RepID=T1ICF7_RHOPR